MKVEKAYAISDAKISFVSLVDKAANKKKFLIRKSDDCEDDSQEFVSYGKIIQKSEEGHLVTGIVYEPMTEDTDGNYMTAEEIEKTAHWYLKNGKNVDIQHCYEAADGVDVVESYVTKSDTKIGNENVKPGTWIMTMEVRNDGIWNKIEKGEITGFSMGGFGSVSKEESEIKKEEKSILDKIEDLFRRNKKEDMEEMEEIEKQGRCMSKKNIEKIKCIKKEIEGPLEKLKNLLEEIGEPDPMEPEDMMDKACGTSSKKEMQKMVKEEVEKAQKPILDEMKNMMQEIMKMNKESSDDGQDDDEKKEEDLVEKAVKEQIEKSETELKEMMEKMNTELQSLKKSRGIPSNLNDDNGSVQKKQEQHYMHGIL
ncbi:MAG: XkdF-like putative serine protease domain-containing protein [Lachnospiraceae bacterium]